MENKRVMCKYCHDGPGGRRCSILVDPNNLELERIQYTIGDYTGEHTKNIMGACQIRTDWIKTHPGLRSR